MKVIVKESGFYGGTYYTAKAAEQEIPDAVAKRLWLPMVISWKSQKIARRLRVQPRIKPYHHFAAFRMWMAR